MALTFTVRVDPDGNNQLGHAGYSDDARSPENIDFYVTFRAKVTATKSQRPSRIRFVVQKGSDKRHKAGYLITAPGDKDAPKNLGNGLWEWTYRTFGQRSLSTRLNWNVRELKGRWNISVEGHPSNTVAFKINKRDQIVHVARAYAALGLAGTRYPPNGPKPFFTDCFTFNAHVYNRVGLKIGSGTTGTSTDASAPDNGRGAIRFFSLIAYETNPSYHPKPSHSAIVDGDVQIDENNAVARGVGPRVRPKDSGVGTKYSNGPKRGPSSRSLPYPGQAGKSLLQGLDNE